MEIRNANLSARYCPCCGDKWADDLQLPACPYCSAEQDLAKKAGKPDPGFSFLLPLDSDEMVVGNPAFLDALRESNARLRCGFHGEIDYGVAYDACVGANLASALPDTWPARLQSDAQTSPIPSMPRSEGT